MFKKQHAQLNFFKQISVDVNLSKTALFEISSVGKQSLGNKYGLCNLKIAFQHTNI